MYKPKNCIVCQTTITYKNWATHLRSDKHTTNNARCNIMLEQKREEERVERLQQEHAESIKHVIIEKLNILSLGSPTTNTFNPVFKEKAKIVFNHRPGIPNNFRMLMLGESNCGKTNLLLRMILTPDCLDFNNLIIFTSTAHQKEYQLLHQGFNNNLCKEDIIEIFVHSEELCEFSIEDICYALRKERTDASITCQLSSSESEIQHPNDIGNSTIKTLVVFDDVVCMRNQDLLSEYFVLGRHYNINTIYLAQSLIKVPKNCIRDNSNMFILFHLNKMDINYLYNNLFKNFNGGIDKDEFISSIEELLRDQYSYITYSKDKKDFIQGGIL